MARSILSSAGLLVSLSIALSPQRMEAPQLSEDPRENRLSDSTFQNWRLVHLSVIFRGGGEILLDYKQLLI